MTKGSGNFFFILQIQLVAIVDWGEPLLKTTYRLEGDGAPAFECYEVIDTIPAFIFNPEPHLIYKLLLIDYLVMCLVKGS